MACKFILFCKLSNGLADVIKPLAIQEFKISYLVPSFSNASLVIPVYSLLYL